MEESFTAIPEGERVPVMDRVVAGRRRGEGVGFGLLETDTIVAGGHAVADEIVAIRCEVLHKLYGQSVL